MKATVSNLLKRIKKTITRPDMVLLPGQLAFFLVLGIIPTITLVCYFASVLNLSMDFLFEFLEIAFSKEIASLMLSASKISSAGIQLIVILIICYYLSSNGTNSVIVTSNAIYGIKNGNWFKRRLKAIIISVLFVILIAFLLLIPIFGQKIVDLIAMVNMNEHVTKIIKMAYVYLRSPIMWALLFLFIKIIYIISPDRKIKTHNANYGALFTTISWILTTEIYSYYINNIANYTAFYGGLTSICILMIWFYFLSYFFVIGMSLNYQKETEDLEKTGVIKTVKK